MMKKFGFLCFFAVIFFFTACAPTPSMSELLLYQTEEKEMALRLTDGGTVFHAKLQHKENELFLIFTDEARKDIGYRMDTDGKIFMVCGDFEIAVTDDAYLRCKEWFSLFRLTAGDTIWKIKKETLGGIDVFVCHDGMITIYTDCNTRIPLKITKGDITVDVLGYE